MHWGQTTARDRARSLPALCHQVSFSQLLLLFVNDRQCFVCLRCWISANLIYSSVWGSAHHLHVPHYCLSFICFTVEKVKLSKNVMDTWLQCDMSNVGNFSRKVPFTNVKFTFCKLHLFICQKKFMSFSRRWFNFNLVSKCDLTFTGVYSPIESAKERFYVSLCYKWINELNQIMKELYDVIGLLHISHELCCNFKAHYNSYLFYILIRW